MRTDSPKKSQTHAPHRHSALHGHSPGPLLGTVMFGAPSLQRSKQNEGWRVHGRQRSESCVSDESSTLRREFSGHLAYWQLPEPTSATSEKLSLHSTRAEAPAFQKKEPQSDTELHVMTRAHKTISPLPGGGLSQVTCAPSAYASPILLQPIAVSGQSTVRARCFSTSTTVVRTTTHMQRSSKSSSPYPLHPSLKTVPNLSSHQGTDGSALPGLQSHADLDLLVNDSGMFTPEGLRSFRCVLSSHHVQVRVHTYACTRMLCVYTTRMCMNIWVYT